MRIEAEVEHDPIWVGEIDLSQTPDSLSVYDRSQDETFVHPSRYKIARILVRFRSEPIGIRLADVDPEGSINVEKLAKDAENHFFERIDRIAAGFKPANGSAKSDSLMSSELAALAETNLPGISVVIGTMRRPDESVTCVRAVLDQQYGGPLEVIVVDNGIMNDKTQAAIERNFGQDARVKYVAEIPPGLSRARNVGLAKATYPITAFLSDDIRVDPLWALGIARGFQRSASIKAVNGFCIPRFLDNANQIESERAMGWATSQGFDPLIYDFVDPDRPLHPYAGCFSNGSNMAFDTEFFLTAGGFAEDLGPGTIARGGEDLEAPVRVLARGGQVAYEPMAFGWVYDQYDGRSFTRQAYSYGIGLTAYLMHHLMDSQHRSELVKRAPKGIKKLGEPFTASDVALPVCDARIARRAKVAQMLGRAVGPVAYLRSRRAVMSSLPVPENGHTPNSK